MAAVEGAYAPHYRTSIALTLPDVESTRMSRSTNLNLERPSSALLRGVKITEFRDAKVNPDPVPLEESELLLEEYLSPRKLRDLTGIEDLEDVKYLELRVNTQDTSLGNFGMHLPNLTQLKLSNSIISTIRDLGSSLHILRVLWMARCGVEDLDGISSMNNLQELYLAYNDLNDISPCSLLENLQILDLEGNNIDEISQIHFLNSCSKLENLALEGNPVCVTPSPDEASPGYDYRRAVKEAIPHLSILDDDVLTFNDTKPRKTTSVFEDDWALIDELMQDGTVTMFDDSLDSSVMSAARPPTSSIRPATSARPTTSSRCYTGTGIRPGTRSGRPGTSMRPFTSHRSSPTRPSSGRPGSNRSGGRPDSAGRLNSAEEANIDDDASDLTQGGVVCGNPSKALKARKRPKHAHSQSAAKILSQLKHRPEHTYDVDQEEDENVRQLLEDLKEWRTSYNMKQQEIEATKAPQVLRIDHDDTMSLSDSDSVVSEDELFSPQQNYQMDSLSINSGALVEEDDPPLRRQIEVRPRLRQERARRGSLKYDESFETTDEAKYSSEDNSFSRTPYSSSSKKSSSTGEVRSPSPVTQTDRDLRPLSQPAPASKPSLRLFGPVDKTKPKVFDHSNPIVRASVHSPEGRILEGPRADTAKAALGPVQPTRMRKGLVNVPLLPSKFTK